VGYSTLNAETLLAMLGGKWAPNQPNIHRLPVALSEPYFIYLTGHGGDYYFKVREREALVSSHFTLLLRDLWARGRKSSI
jgi:glycosylphosphatidylinositol transamidase (GPIT) subunit GPI8